MLRHTSVGHRQNFKALFFQSSLKAPGDVQRVGEKIVVNFSFIEIYAERNILDFRIMKS